MSGQKSHRAAAKLSLPAGKNRPGPREKFISNLNLYIFKLEIHNFNLQLCNFRLQINFASYPRQLFHSTQSNFSPDP